MEDSNDNLNDKVKDNSKDQKANSSKDRSNSKLIAKSVSAVTHHVKTLVTDIFEVTYELFKIMIPTVIVIKILEELGGVAVLSTLLAPLMHSLGLPEEMALVWAATLLTNMYAGMLIFFTYFDGTMSIAQVSVIGGMMLMAHGLPVEVLVAKKAGVRLGFTLLLRLGSGIIYGYLLHFIYSSGQFLQQPAKMLWQPESVELDPNVELSNVQAAGQWLLEQAQGFLAIFVIIAVLLTFLRLMKVVGIERLISWLLSPLLRLLGISRKATTITLVGFTLGLSFGGGLLIKEANAGHVSKKDVFSALTLLALSHSMIEDTLLILLLGAHMSAVLWIRIVFTFIVAALLIRWALSRNESFQKRFLYTE